VSLYTPAHFAATERAIAARIIHDRPFATLVTPAAPEPLISHIPLLLVADREPHGTLIGHVARANAHWRHVAGVDSIAIFHGPHAYVSPSWYTRPEAAVPTWNYATVHAHGAIEVLDDPVEARGVLDTLVQRFESLRARPWTFSMPPDARDALVAAIVAFRMPVQRVEAKLKLSQNRPAGDRVRVIAALDAEGEAEATAVAEWMRALVDMTAER
jgi:transcriptional regulator